MNLRRTAVLLVAAGLGLAACGGGSVSTSDLEEKVADALEQQVGQRPEVDCPDELKAEEGASVRCTLTADDGSTIGATVTATKVEGDTVNFDIQVDES